MGGLGPSDQDCSCAKICDCRHTVVVVVSFFVLALVLVVQAVVAAVVLAVVVVVVVAAVVVAVVVASVVIAMEQNLKRRHSLRRGVVLQEC